MTSCLHRLPVALLTLGVLTAAGVGPAPAAPVVIYDNTAATIGPYTGQSGSESIDDIHAYGRGQLSGITFGYDDPDLGGGPFSVEIRVYRNPGGQDEDIIPLAGPFTAGGLARGEHLVHLPIADGPEIDQHVWVGVRFTSSTAGLLVCDPPVKGYSNDYYVENGQFFFFGGNPPANFCLKVEVESGTVDAGGRAETAGFVLGSAVPHPAQGGRARVSFALPSSRRVRIHLFDVTGRRVRTLLDEVRDAGEHALTLPVGTPPGVYFLRMTAGPFRESRKLVVID